MTSYVNWFGLYRRKFKISSIKTTLIAVVMSRTAVDAALIPPLLQHSQTIPHWWFKWQIANRQQHLLLMSVSLLCVHYARLPTEMIWWIQVHLNRSWVPAWISTFLQAIFHGMMAAHITKYRLRPKTANISSFGSFKSLRMLTGIRNASQAFQSFSDSVISVLDFCCV